MLDGALRPALVFLAILISTSASPTLAQDTNLSIYQRLALECMGELPSDVDTLALQASAQMPYLRTALIERWRSDGHEVYSVDNSPPQTASLPRLTFTIEDAGVEYEPVGRRRLNRSIRLGLQYSLTQPDGRIVLDERCAIAAADTIDRMAVAQIEDHAHVETQGSLPPAGWVRRVVEPAVIVAATAIGVYLFFTLRSQSAEDG